MENIIKEFDEFCKNAVAPAQHISSDGTIIGVANAFKKKKDIFESKTQVFMDEANKRIDEYGGDKEVLKEELVRISQQYLRSIF